jgi:hypothetical protein
MRDLKPDRPLIFRLGPSPSPSPRGGAIVALHLYYSSRHWILHIDPHGESPATRDHFLNFISSCLWTWIEFRFWEHHFNHVESVGLAPRRRWEIILLNNLVLLENIVLQVCPNFSHRGTPSFTPILSQTFPT